MSGENRLSVGIVGAGILGRLLALKGDQLGWKITLFDRGDENGKDACSFLPPAMLSPTAELDVSEHIIASLGKEALKLWPEIVKSTCENVFFQKSGSLIVAHPHDRHEMARFKNSLQSKTTSDAFRSVAGAELQALEPQLDRCFTDGLYIPDEGQIDSRGILSALAKALRDRKVDCHYNQNIPNLQPKKIVANDTAHDFDLVIDARGYGAANDLPDLRAVRGEIIRVHAPDIQLNRPVRLLHPRYPIYVVPHDKGEFVIGATSIESEDPSPISVRSALELLSAAFTLNAKFGEARITDMSVGLRPAFPDNLPRIMCEPGLLRINGLYRHGYLISPKLVELACDYVATGSIDSNYQSLFRVA